jgi:hypothetical protein
VEPICYLTESEYGSLASVPIDPIFYDFELGKETASFIDAERNDYVEQALVPYILDWKYKYILIADNPITFSEERLAQFMDYLKGNPQILEKVRGLIHYHADEPELSDADFKAMIQYTKRMKSLGGTNQLGIVLSEKEPEDTLLIRQYGEEEFTKHLFAKLRDGRIDVVGESFTGAPNFHSSLNIEIDL